MIKPLEGVRVIDLSTYLAAPSVGRLMAEWGAEVIKVETMSGDPYRHIGPTMGMPITEKANPNFDEQNAFKNFMALNLRTPEGMEILHKLLAGADVFLTNNRAKALEAMGLTWEKLHAQYPRLVFAQVFGYGEFGPMKDTPGFDFTAFWARSGLLVDLAPAGGTPINPVPGVGDHCVSLALTAAIASCLYRRNQTGEGDKVDASLLQLATWVNKSSTNSCFYGRTLSRNHYQVNQANNTFYKCADGEWIYMSANDYKKLNKTVVVDVLDHPELLDDPRFNTFEEYLKHTGELVAIYEDIFATRTRAEWDERMTKADIAHELCMHVGDTITDPQVLENNYIVIHEYEDGTKSAVTPAPVHIGSIDWRDFKFQTSKPLGADNDRYLAELGYTAEQIAGMREKGQIV